MGKIIITGRDEVLKTLDEQRGVVAVLSIEHPGAAATEDGAPRLSNLPQEILAFRDIETPDADAPDIAQIEKGLGFSLAWLAQGDVLIHCQAGIARSTALALGVLAFQNPGRNEKDLINMLLDLRPAATPNMLAVGIVDGLAGRGGKLLQAVLDHPVLSEHRRVVESVRQNLTHGLDVSRAVFFDKPPPKP